MKSLALPASLNDQILAALRERGYSEQSPKHLAAAVQRLSDFYIAFPEESTPWQEKWAQLAYIGYYLPLNYLRNVFVIEEAQRLNFFSGLEQVVDIGSGLGAGSLALADAGALTAEMQLTLVEKAPQAIALQEEFFQKSLPSRMTRREELSDSNLNSQSLGLMSYSLTEMLSFPETLEKLSALMIVEPSTQSDGRSLLEVRQQLLTKGFYAWAPCLHQQDCPMLAHSLGDWCHHKFIPILPDWLKASMKLLPMHTGEVLSLSYLLLKKEAPPSQAGLTRVVGDTMREKGKSRQLVCRSSEREFLSWLRRDHKKPKGYSRHDLIKLPDGLDKAGNEIRIPKGESPPVLDETSEK